jgi:hypothetical protein
MNNSTLVINNVRVLQPGEGVIADAISVREGK